MRNFSAQRICTQIKAKIKNDWNRSLAGKKKVSMTLNSTEPIGATNLSQCRQNKKNWFMKIVISFAY